MDAESSVDKAARSKRRSRSRSTLSRRSTEDSSNADSNGSSAEKEVPSKDSELHNGAVGETEDVDRENAVETATEVPSVNAKGEEKHGEKQPRVGDKWKLHLDLSDSCSLSENDASDVDGTSAPSASHPVDESQAEEPETKPSVVPSDDRMQAEPVADDSSMVSDTSEFHGFEDSAFDQEYIDSLIGTIHKWETADDDCCLNSDVEVASSPKTEPEYDQARTYSHDDDSNSSSVFGHFDSVKGLLSPASHLNVPSSKGKQKVKYSGSPVPSTSRSGTSKKSSVDLSNPAFRKPLDMGWKREIVFRSAGDSSTKRLSDVYYFTPSGRKVRSTREVMENLEGTDLTLDNFTFFKDPLGINDPEKEIIRDARRMSVTPKETGSPATPSGSSMKRIQKLKASAGGMSPASDQSSTSGLSTVKQEPMSVEEETDGLSESSSSGSLSREQAGAAAETSATVEQKIPPAIAGPSGLNKHAGRSQSHVKLARSFPRIKVTSPRSGRGRGQASPRGGGVNRGAASQAGSSSSGNMEMGMLPPMWKDKDGASTTKVLSSPGAAPGLQSTPSRGLGRLPRGGKAGGQGTISPKDAAAESRKRKASASPPEEAAGASKKPRTVDAANGDTGPLHTFMSRYMANVCDTYNAMLHIFEYLKVQELLRASRVCRLWCSIATHESLWQTVRLKNSPVADWKGCVATLARRGTRHLDMRKMLVPAGRAEDWWAAFCANIGRVPCLESVELCRCPAAVVERVAQQCPQLTTLSALSIKDQAINLGSIGQLKNLQELRIRNLSGMYLNGNLDGLKELTNLKHLSLTMVKNLGHAGCGVLGCLQTLETLELGECCDLPATFGNQTLSQLQSLQRLRLEKGQGDGCPTFALLAGVRTLPSLVTLELVNFDVKPGFDTALAKCQNVQRLLIIPTYISQSATTNHMVLGGVTKLGNSLTHFVWGVTHELLRVTELFVDQCEDQKGPPGSQAGKDKDKKKSSTPPTTGAGAGAGDSIPVLRPVPGSIPPEDGGDKNADSERSSPTSNSSSAVPTPGAPQVDILPLTKLQKMLATALPNTKIKILKVAFQATWRQYISETDF